MVTSIAIIHNKKSSLGPSKSFNSIKDAETQKFENCCPTWIISSDINKQVQWVPDSVTIIPLKHHSTHV